MPEPQLLQRAPQSAQELFAAFTWLALQGFGGVLPVAQRELVERHGWLTREQFVETLSVAQVLPGPNIVNMALMIGDRFLGWRGALAALGGILLAPLGVVLVLALFVRQAQHLPLVSGALRGMGAVAAGLILSTALRLGVSLRHSALGIAWCGVLLLATVVMVAVLRWPLWWAVLGLGAVGMTLAWRRLPR